MRTCRQCQAELSPSAKFCSECGAKTTASRGPGPVSGERRQVTILFADISGYTQLSSQIDPEELHALLERYFATVDGAVRDFGGTVDKHIGDAVMGVFGAPVSHGNDAERAVRAALAIHARVAQLETGLGRPIAVHLGVANGEVVAGSSGSDVHREYTVLGDAVNLASRLDGLASAGETVISAGVQRAVAALVETESAGEVSVRGLSQPVRVFKLLGLVPEHGRRNRPLFGRTAELERFASLTARISAGRGAVCCVLGEPGVGKTRLLAALREHALALGFEAHSGLVLDFGTGRGQGAVQTLLQSCLGIPPEDDLEQRRSAVQRSAEASSLDPSELAALNDLLELPQPAALQSEYAAMQEERRAEARGRAFAAAFTAAAARRPQLVVVEDVHWADSMTLGLIEALAQRCASAPIALLLSSRVDGSPFDEAWRERLASLELERMELAPLDERSARELALSLGAKDEQLATLSAHRSGGNPLFLEQLLASEAEGALPDTIQSLVQARMDRLEPLDKRALQAAAVIGQRFSLELLRHLLAEPSYTCERLVERGMVRSVDGVWAFAHALVRDGAYSSLLKQVRRGHHKRAAAWFGSSDPMLRAEHLDRAEDEDAANAYAAAAAACMRSFATERALSLITRGLELASRPDDVFRLSHVRGELMLIRGDAPAALLAFEHALENATTDLQSCRAAIGVADAHRIVQRTAEGSRALERALSFAQESMDAELSTIHRVRGSLEFVDGRDSVESQELAFRYAVRAGDVALEARALSCLGDAHYLNGHCQRAHEYFVRCIELCQSHGLGRIELYQHYMVGIARLFMGDARGALADTDRATEQSRRAGHRRGEMIARETAAMVLVQMGEHARALAEIDVALELARETGSSMFEALLMTEQADALLLAGRSEEARSVVERAGSMPASGHFWLVGPMLASLRVRFARDRAEAQGVLDASATLFTHRPRSIMELFFRARVAETCLEVGYADLAEGYAKAALRDVEDAALIQLSARRTLCLLDYARGSRRPELLSELRELHTNALELGLLPAARSIEGSGAFG